MSDAVSGRESEGYRRQRVEYKNNSDPGNKLPKNKPRRLEQPPQQWECVSHEVLMGPELDHQIDELFED